MNDQIKLISEEEICFLKRYFNESKFGSRTSLIYQGQIPTAAYILLSGTIDIKSSNNDVLLNLKEKILIGFHEINQNLKFKYTVDIYPESVVLILNRSRIEEITCLYLKNKLPTHFRTYQLIHETCLNDMKVPS